MIKVPGWLDEFFEKGNCPNCKKTLFKNNVFGLGIREEKIRNKKVLSLCFEYFCKFCNQKTVFTGFPISFERFVSDLNEMAMLDSSYNAYTNSLNENDDEENDEQYEQEKQSPKKSSITTAEIKEFVEALKKIKTHDEFLEKLGIPIDKDKKNED